MRPLIYGATHLHSCARRGEYVHRADVRCCFDKNCRRNADLHTNCNDDPDPAQHRYTYTNGDSHIHISPANTDADSHIHKGDHSR